MKRFKLSNSEEILMDTLWRENRPLTTLQLAEKVTEARWNTHYIDKLLGQLVKKGMVQVSGLLQNGRYQSRQFVPCYTKDEFLANMLEEQGVNQALFARIAVALFKKEIPSKYLNVINGIGFALLMALMLFVTFHDIVKLL